MRKMVIKEKNNMGSVPNFSKSLALNFGFTYDAIGRRTSLSLPNGVKTNFAYDSGSNLLEMIHQTPSQVVEKLTYAYDKNGNRTGMNRLNVSSKLPNPANNITYNSANQMLTFNDKNITYDANGNMETINNSCGTTTYSWDARNRLVGISGFTNNCSPITANFKYDALGRRIERTVNGKTINYLYDGLDIVQEIENGKVSANYIRTLNIDEPLARIKSDGTIRYYQQDALGSIIALTDEAGIIKTQYIYDPFGNVTTSGESSDNPFQYTGRENDGTGLYYYRARYYSPELHRFISEDPIGFLGGDVNLYSYVGNNPVNRIDPFGLFDSDCFAKCVEENRWDWGWLTAATIGNPLANAMAGKTGRTGVGGVPSHATTWQHKAGSWISKATNNPWFGRVGKGIGRVALIPTVAEGFYDIGAIGRCAALCSGEGSGGNCQNSK